MKSNEMRQIVCDFCKVNVVPETEILIGADSHSDCKKSFRANTSGKELANIKYIVQYFYVIDRVIIWNRNEHKEKTKIFTVCRSKVEKIMNEKINVIKDKGVEFDWRKTSWTYVCKISELADILNILYEI